MSLAAARHRPRGPRRPRRGRDARRAALRALRRRPLAVVLDVDETALHNLGFEYDDATHPGRPYDQAALERAGSRPGPVRSLPIPGAVAALDARAPRRRDRDLQLEPARRQCRGEPRRRSNGAGLGPAHATATTLWLQGDDALRLAARTPAAPRSPRIIA